jgi:hypothetical protein
VKRYRELSEVDKNGVRFITWLVCGVALLALAVWRTSLEDIGTQMGRIGGVVGAVLGPLLIASLLWLLVQRVIRKQRGFPPWVGAIAVAISGVALAAQAGSLASAEDACKVVANPFGAAPAGWSYQAADLEQREALIKELKYEQLEQYGLDASFAYLGDEEDPGAVLISLQSVTQQDLDEFLDGVDKEARTQHAKAARRSIGGADVRVVDPTDGSRAMFGVTRCKAMIVIGFQARSADLLARAVFTDS